jgi:hypothetical protein
MNKETIMQRTYASEFGPKYHPEPEVLHLLGQLFFLDSSWHNDTCPSWTYEFNDRSTLIVFVQPADATLREWPEAKRFNVQIRDPEGDLTDYDFDTDDQGELRAHLVRLLRARGVEAE